MAEIRNMREGMLRWVQASGSGNGWATATSPASGVFGFVRSFSFTSAQTIQTISDRGTPNHHKVVSKDPPSLTVNIAWTGNLPTALSGTGASVPMFHLEYRANEPENGNSGRYAQFYGAPVQQWQFTEADTEDTIAFTFPLLGMSGWNASGYLG